GGAEPNREEDTPEGDAMLTPNPARPRRGTAELSQQTSHIMYCSYGAAVVSLQRRTNHQKRRRG
ncbi:MAG: hypothetical protein ACKPKO_16950, partial [Candidatus Fonsibacter sp.]